MKRLRCAVIWRMVMPKEGRAAGGATHLGDIERRGKFECKTRIMVAVKSNEPSWGGTSSSRPSGRIRVEASGCQCRCSSASIGSEKNEATLQVANIDVGIKSTGWALSAAPLLLTSEDSSRPRRHQETPPPCSASRRLDGGRRTSRCVSDCLPVSTGLKGTQPMEEGPISDLVSKCEFHLEADCYS